MFDISFVCFLSLSCDVKQIQTVICILFLQSNSVITECCVDLNMYVFFFVLFCFVCVYFCDSLILVFDICDMTDTYLLKCCNKMHHIYMYVIDGGVINIRLFVLL